MPRVLVTPIVYRDGRGPWRDVLDQARFEVVIPQEDCTQISSDRFQSLLTGIDGTLASVEKYDRQVLSASTQLKVVARVGVGYDAVNVPAATEHGIAVSITPGTNEHSVAEQAIALLTAVFRDTARRDGEIRRGTWRRDCPRRLAGNVIGLVGLGRIGKAMVSRCQGLGLKVLAFDPYADPAWSKSNSVELTTFEDLLSRSDIVSLHMPCTPETVDLINRSRLSQMKRGSVLINTSRGGLVDEDALVEALRSGHLFGAGLDVCKVEPLPPSSPLNSLANVVLSPHLGGIDQTALDAMGQLAAQCLVDLLTGRWPAECVVNPTVRSTWERRASGN